jgi:GntR family transcriptional regulator
MHIQLSLTDGVPIYRQIVNQIKYAVATGAVVAGQELPPIRILAERLSVTPNTIVKAYDELEGEGVVVKRRGAGTYISDEQAPLARKEQRQILSERIDGLLAEACRFGFTLDEIDELIEKRHPVIAKRFAKTENSNV